MDLTPGRLQTLPVQIIEIDDGIILKRGCVETSVRGKGAVEAVRRLLEATSGAGMPAAAIRDLFSPAERDSVDALIEHLRRRGLLVNGSLDSADDMPAETPADVFYWHFGIAGREAGRSLADRRVVVVGLNGIGRQLRASLASCGVTSVALVDDPLLRNPWLFDQEGIPKSDVWSSADGPGIIDASDIDPDGLDCLVAASEFGAPSIVGRWNELCVLHKRPFLPVVLNDLIGSIGPLVIPGETACYECARMRQRTHQPDPYLRQAIEAATPQGGTAGFLPPMSSILGDLAALELVRFFCLGALLPRVGVLIEVSLLARQMTPRPVLKLPRCPVCTPIDQRPTLTTLEAPAMVAARGDR